MRGAFLLLSSLLFLNTVLRADDVPPKKLSPDQRAEVAQGLSYQTGLVTLRGGLAKIALKPGWRFLNGPDSEKVLHDLWGNPPSEAPLGMLFPPDNDPLKRGGWAVVVGYEENGHVNDADAAKINYDELLKNMKQEAADANAERQRLGYATVDLIGWAQPPRYDAATHKLYWARDLRFAGESGDTLNYDLRVLGRRGVLVLQAISGMHDLDTVSTEMPEVLTMVDFQPGNTYAEFDPTVDKVAKYGIAGLVAGTAVVVAAKAGLFAALGKFLLPVILVFKKAFILVVVAGVALFKKISAAIKGKSAVARPFEHPPGTAPGAPVAPALNEPPPPNHDPLRPPGGGFPPTKSF